jgi:hypothetical protein
MNLDQEDYFYSVTMDLWDDPSTFHPTPGIKAAMLTGRWRAQNTNFSSVLEGKRVGNVKTVGPRGLHRILQGAYCIREVCRLPQREEGLCIEKGMGLWMAYPVVPVKADFKAIAAFHQSLCDKPDYSGDAFIPEEAAKLKAKFTPEFFESLCDGRTGFEVNDILTDLFFDAVGMPRDGATSEEEDAFDKRQDEYYQTANKPEPEAV